MSKLPAFCVFRGFDPEPPTVHEFDRHYLLYAVTGTMRLSSGGRCWSLPPARAALIAAGVPITVAIERPLQCCSALFAPAAYTAPDAPLTVFEMTTLLRELMQELRQFGPGAEHLTAEGKLLFDTAFLLARRQAGRPSHAWMPVATSATLVAALAHTQAALAEPVRFEDVAEAVCLSPRTLARRFADEVGMTWRHAQRRLRMIAAIELLALESRPVTDIAFAVGYNSPSAFNAAFRDFTGLSPSDYRASMHPGTG